MKNLNDISIAVAQLEIIAGRPDLNVLKMLQSITAAIENGDHVIVFPEMAIPGYMLGDEWENTAFIMDCYEYNKVILEASQNIIVIWGNVDIDKNRINEDGRIRKYNAAFIAQNGNYVGTGVVHKTHLPKYREFDDARHFYSYRKELQDDSRTYEEGYLPFSVSIDKIGFNIGLILCEDMWSTDYSINPIDYLLENGSDIIVNLSCSPWTWRKNNKRHRVVRERISRKPVPFIYCNNTGIQNNGKNIFLFDGNSTFYNSDGTLHLVADSYKEKIIRANPFVTEKAILADPLISKDADTDELYHGLIYGIRKFFEKLPTKKVVIGISGGIDSTLSTLLLAEALGPENVYGVNMPSMFNSQTTKDAAYQLAKALGIHYAVIPIQESYDLTVSQMENTAFTRLDSSDLTEPVVLSSLNKENIQARDRGSRILAAVASAINAVFVNNGNKTEIALGYATLYGDVNGAFSPIGDLYKWEVYHLTQYIHELKNVVPECIFTIPASAELSEEQNVDEGKGDPIKYAYHDHLVRAFVEFRMDPEDILKFYQEGNLETTIKCEDGLVKKLFKSDQEFIDDLEHKWRSYKISIFKRIQAPPVITVSRRAFGFDLREAQNSYHFTRRYLKLKEEILSK